MSEQQLIDKLYQLIYSEDGMITVFRCENRFSDEIYKEIINIIKLLTKVWRTTNSVPKKAFVCICNLIEQLAGGNRFLSEEDAIKTEDATIAIIEEIIKLEEKR